MFEAAPLTLPDPSDRVGPLPQAGEGSFSQPASGIAVAGARFFSSRDSARKIDGVV